MDKDTRKVLKAGEAQGFTWTRTASGHARVTKNGVYVTTFSGTPSDVKGFRNGVSAMRRHGFVWPPRR